MIDTPQIVQVAARATAVIRLTVPRHEIQLVMGPAMQEVINVVTAQDAGIAGPLYSHHFRMDPGIFDFEVGVPVERPVTASGRVLAGELPAATVARTVYAGPYEKLGEAWGELMQWIAGAGHEPAPGLWECYLSGPESSPDPAQWRTELNRPLVR